MSKYCCSFATNPDKLISLIDSVANFMNERDKRIVKDELSGFIQLCKEINSLLNRIKSVNIDKHSELMHAFCLLLFFLAIQPASSSASLDFPLFYRESACPSRCTIFSGGKHFILSYPSPCADPACGV